MKIIAGQRALITGTSRGLGIEIAKRFAAAGVDLVLAARSVAALEEVAGAIRSSYPVSVTTQHVDMADVSSVRELATVAGEIDILVNNAGVEGAAGYDERALSEITDTIAVNLTGPMVLTHALLPGMLSRGRGHIVNVASLAGLMPVAFNEPYSASKAGLIGFTRSLRLTAQANTWPVSATVLCPGFMDGAGMFEDLKNDHSIAPEALGAMPADQIGSAVVAAIEEDQAQVILSGGDIREIVVLATIDPSAYEAMMLMAPATEMFREVAGRRRGDSVR